MNERLGEKPMKQHRLNEDLVVLFLFLTVQHRREYAFVGILFPNSHDRLCCHDHKTVRADYKAKELLQTIAIDEPYFLMTGGGVTFGGGEPLLQA